MLDHEGGTEGLSEPFPVKLMFIVTYDVRGIIVCHFVPHSRTVNAQFYRDFLLQQLLRRWGWKELEHPPYSSEISPCDFYPIPKITEPIHGRWFATREDIANTVRQQVLRFTHGVANAEADGIQRLPHR
ncbi:histone-lysine N-methyltransferase SETMAR [Trichonephila clavata]|uniref:Histone-lysine N-methyltransferase SETMAR n=1 Tax=Trichonephila clavata TaxID=2740835 RepID=A0A8X6LJM4_TRICU|nr:histone-lysine N-methyltransferase SETMAR [Trichonephila clavata]